MKNAIDLVGNLGKDPEFKTTTSGAVLCTCSLATTESYKDKNGEWVKTTQWHNLIAWRQNAQKLNTLSKGDCVVVFGMLEYDQYEDKNGVNKVYAKIKVKDIYKAEVIKIEEFNQMAKDKTPQKVSDFTERVDPEDDLPF